jgi:hypothetical protein
METIFQILLDENGVVDGMVQSNTLQEGSVEVDEATFREAIAKQGRVKWDGSKLIDLPPLPPPPPPPPVARLAAIADLAVEADVVSGIETSTGFGFAMPLDTGLYWVFFAEPMADTAYFATVQAPGFYADVTYPLNPDYLEITVTDRASGAPANPGRLLISVMRTQ